MPTQVTYKTEHISLFSDSTISSEINFCFVLFYRNLKEKDHIRRNINSKKIYLYVNSVLLFCFAEN